jgi:hypothetical protein
LHQIKEKFGTLCYYFWPSSDDPSPELIDAMYAVTDSAEHVSATICERCGNPGTLHQSPRVWVKTLCGSCANELGYNPVPVRTDF